MHKKAVSQRSFIDLLSQHSSCNRYSNPGNVLTQKPVLSSAYQTPSLYTEHWHCLWKSAEIPSKARALLYDKEHITAVIVTEQPSYIWQQPMKTRPLKGRLMPSHPFNSDLHLLIQLAFHIPVDKIQPRERDRDACSIYIVVESFTAFKPHRLELNLKICPLTSFEESLIFQKMLCSLCTNGLARESGYALVTKSVIFLCI